MKRFRDKKNMKYTYKNFLSDLQIDNIYYKEERKKWKKNLKKSYKKAKEKDLTPFFESDFYDYETREYEMIYNFNGIILAKRKVSK